MKNLKFLFFLLIFITTIYSCTNDEDENYENINIEKTQATGADGDYQSDGSKD